MLTTNLLTFRVMPKAKTSLEIRKDFGRWLQNEREIRGISQKYVAKEIRMSVTQLSRIENGESGTKRDTVILLAQTIGADEEEALRQFRPEHQFKFNSDLLDSVRLELAGSDGWSNKQKDDFLQMLKILVAGIKADPANNLAGSQNLIFENEIIPKDFDPKGISQEEFFKQAKLIQADDEGTVDIDKDKKKKAG